jgi:hypothetical protein
MLTETADGNVRVVDGENGSTGGIPGTRTLVKWKRLHPDHNHVI